VARDTGQPFFVAWLAAAILVLAPALASAQDVEALPEPPPQNTDQTQDLTPFTGGTIERISVIGNERIEGATIVSYLTVHVGDPFTPQGIDASLKNLFATGLFSNVVMERTVNMLIIRVTENPIVSQIALEGNSRLKDDKITTELQLQPRMVYTRARVRADVQRIIDLYQRSGRFAAVVEPKVIQRDQNRVDIVYEISEGPKSRVSKINFLGNRAFSDRKLRGQLKTTEARWWKIFSSGDTYDPDRVAFDREEVRKYYLNNGYADVRIASVVAELTPDQKAFLITYVIEEGQIYKFGGISVLSDIPELPAGLLENFVSTYQGKLYNASDVEQSVENITNAGGVVGFAFLDVRPEVERDREAQTISIVYHVYEAPRTYIERIDIHGNVRTLDRVIRREFRLAEGDAFNSVRVQRSEQRLKLLGFFRVVTVEHVPGSAPDRVVLDVTVEEQSTGEFSLGLGYSSFDSFLIDTSISERNFLGKGQQVQLSLLISRRRKNINLGFTQPYFLNRNMTGGVQFFRTQLNSRESSFNTRSFGGSFRLAFPLTEFMNVTPHYLIRRDHVTVPASLLISPFIREQAGDFMTSAVGYNIGYVNVDDYRFPSRGWQILFVQDFAGLGGNVQYIRTTLDLDYYKPITKKWIIHFGLSGGYIKGLGQRVRINDRFFLGNPKFRGFDVAGIGPVDLITGDRLGGNIYYVGTFGITLPLGSFAEELGVQVSAYVDVGTLYHAELATLLDSNGNPVPANPVFDSNQLRLSAGIGLSWDSPFGPVRIDIARAILKSPFDKTQLISFNVGTRF
jgi:outer membrane protein insertion porin family